MASGHETSYLLSKDGLVTRQPCLRSQHVSHHACVTVHMSSGVGGVFERDGERGRRFFFLLLYACVMEFLLDVTSGSCACREIAS